MLAALAIAGTALAILGDDEEEDIDALLRRAVLVNDPNLVLSRFSDAELRDLFGDLLAYVNSSTSLEDIAERVPLYVFLREGIRYAPRAVHLSDYSFLQGIPVFGDAPYGLSRNHVLLLSDRSPDGSRKRVVKVGSNQAAGTNFSVISWDDSRILISPLGQEIAKAEFEIHDAKMIVPPSTIMDGIRWADCTIEDQKKLAAFITRKSTSTNPTPNVRKLEGFPPGFGWSSEQDGAMLPPELDHREQRIVLANGEQGDSKLSFIWDLLTDEEKGTRKHAPWRSSREKLYWFQYGVYSPPHVLIWADSFEEALEVGAEWVKERSPGLLVDPDYKDAAKDLGLTWPLPEDDEDYEANFEAIVEAAEADLTRTESGFLTSHEWTGGEVQDPLTVAWAVTQSELVIAMILTGNFEEE